MMNGTLSHWPMLSTMSGFKVLLVVLDKLDEETAEEHPYEEDTEYQPRAVACAAFPVHVHEYDKDGEVAERLVYLCRVRRFGKYRLHAVGVPGSHVLDKAESQGRSVT